MYHLRQKMQALLCGEYPTVAALGQAAPTSEDH